jgi:hypothetical protein
MVNDGSGDHVPHPEMVTLLPLVLAAWQLARCLLVIVQDAHPHRGHRENAPQIRRQYWSVSVALCLAQLLFIAYATKLSTR